MNNITMGMALYHINKEAKRELEDYGDRYASCRLYNIKNTVLRKINKKPIDAHIFPMGKMYLYEIDGFTFHAKWHNGYDVESSKNITTAISSENMLGLSMEETKKAYKIINDFLGYEALEY